MVLDGAHTVLDLRDMLIFGRTVEQNPLLGQTRTVGLKFVIHLGDRKGDPPERVHLLDPGEGRLYGVGPEVEDAPEGDNLMLTLMDARKEILLT